MQLSFWARAPKARGADSAAPFQVSSCALLQPVQAGKE